MSGKTSERCLWQKKRGDFGAAVEKYKEQTEWRSIFRAPHEGLRSNEIPSAKKGVAQLDAEGVIWLSSAYVGAVEG